MLKLLTRRAAPLAALALALLPAVASATTLSFTTSGVFSTVGATGVASASGNVLTVGLGTGAGGSNETITFNGSSVVNEILEDDGTSIGVSLGTFLFSGVTPANPFSNVGFTLTITQTSPTPGVPNTAGFSAVINGTLVNNNGNVRLNFNGPLETFINGNGSTNGIRYALVTPQQNLGNNQTINAEVSVAPLPAPALAGMAALGLVGFVRRKRAATTEVVA